MRTYYIAILSNTLSSRLYDEHDSDETTPPSILTGVSLSSALNIARNDANLILLYIPAATPNSKTIENEKVAAKSVRQYAYSQAIGGERVRGWEGLGLATRRATTTLLEGLRVCRD